jgi:lysozyme
MPTALVTVPAKPVPLLARLVMFVVVAAILAACARSPGPPIRGDNAPHPGVNRARAMVVQGIDVSRYQGRIDYPTAARDGVRFVFIKGTEGNDYVDPMFATNWRAARAAGMPHGVYHFMTWCSLARQQAAWFVENTPRDPDALPPVLDLEWNNDSSCKKKFSKADMLEKIRVMLAAMEAHTGKLPIIYTDVNFHRDILAGEHFPNAFGLRSTAAEPQHRYDTRDWTFWQWTQTGVMAGVKGEVDRNVFYGGEEQWATFILTGCDPRALAELGPTGRCRIRNS